MAQTQVQKQQAIRFGSGVLLINGVNVGLLDNAKFNVDYNVIQVRAHNGYLPAKKKPQEVTLTAEIYEIDPVNLALVDGAGDVESLDGSAVSVADEPLTAWEVGSPIKLANANADGSKATNVSITADATSLTDGTDYRVFALNGSTYIEPLTAQTGTILADYDYTPATSKRYTIRDVAQMMEYHEVRFENKDENGKKFSVVIPKGHASGNLELGFVSDDSVDEVMKLPITITANPTDDNVLAYLDDEQVA